MTGLTSTSVFEQHHEQIYRYILRLTRDPAEADDLTQETFLRAHQRLESLQEPAALATWLYRVATHICYDRFRQRSYRRPAESLDAAADEAGGEGGWIDPDAPRLDQVIEQQLTSACVQRHLARLSDSYRAVILLHDLHGMTNPEIAAMLGCSLEAVKIRLHRARKQLQATLEACCDFTCDEHGTIVAERKTRGC